MPHTLTVNMPQTLTVNMPQILTENMPQAQTLDHAPNTDCQHASETRYEQQQKCTQAVLDMNNISSTARYVVLYIVLDMLYYIY